MGGYFKIFYSMRDWQWKGSPNTVALWIDILLNTNYADGYSYGVPVKRGQCITGIKKLSQSTGLSMSATRLALNRLKATNEIAIKTTNKYSIITVINWEKYQCLEKKATNKATNKTTNEQQTNNKQTTTNEEEQEEQEVKEKDLKISSKQETVNPVDYFEKNFGRLISQPELFRLQGWLDEFPVEVINYAFDQCVFQNKRTFSYFEGILKGWQSAGVKSLLDAESQVADYEKSKAIKKNYSYHQDVLPKYMTENREAVETKSSEAEVEETRKLMREMTQERK